MWRSRNAHMRAAVLHELGTIPTFTDFEEPVADDGHEVLEVLLAGLNPVDLYIAAGMYGELSVPCVVGLEGIARLADGGRVYFNGPPKPFGSMAELAPVDVASAFAVPDGLDAGVAVSLGIAGLAAWLPLTWRANLQPGETVLVLGATGVVGQIGVQAAKLLGAGRVVAAARDRPCSRVCASTVPMRSSCSRATTPTALKQAAGDGYDVVLDPIYGEPLEAALAATREGARIVTVGANAGIDGDGPADLHLRAHLDRATATARRRSRSAARPSSGWPATRWPARSSSTSSASRCRASRRPGSARRRARITRSP